MHRTFSVVAMATVRHRVFSEKLPVIEVYGRVRVTVKNFVIKSQSSLNVDRINSLEVLCISKVDIGSVSESHFNSIMNLHITALTLTCFP